MLGDNALKIGEADKARQYFEALDHLGRTLEHQNRISALRMVGESFVKSSKDGLARCEEANAK